MTAPSQPDLKELLAKLEWAAENRVSVSLKAAEATALLKALLAKENDRG